MKILTDFMTHGSGSLDQENNTLKLNISPNNLLNDQNVKKEDKSFLSKLKSISMSPNISQERVKNDSTLQQVNKSIFSNLSPKNLL